MSFDAYAFTFTMYWYSQCRYIRSKIVPGTSLFVPQCQVMHYFRDLCKAHALHLCRDIICTTPEHACRCRPQAAAQTQKPALP